MRLEDYVTSFLTYYEAITTKNWRSKQNRQAQCSEIPHEGIVLVTESKGNTGTMIVITVIQKSVINIQLQQTQILHPPEK